MSFGPNVVSFTITTGRKQNYVIRVYMPPKDQPVVHWVVQSLEHGTAGVEKLLVGNLNACLAQLRGEREEYLATPIEN